MQAFYQYTHTHTHIYIYIYTYILYITDEKGSIIAEAIIGKLYLIFQLLFYSRKYEGKQIYYI